MGDAINLIILAISALWIAAMHLVGRLQTPPAGLAPRDLIYPLFPVLIVFLCAGLPVNGRAGGFLALYLGFGAIILAMMVAVWLVSLAVRDASIMDVAYAPTAAVPTLALLAVRGTWSAHEVILAALPLLWAARLALHIGIRNVGHGEDKRYARWRQRHGANWWWWSLFQVFLLQGVLIWMWSLALAFALHAGPRAFGAPHGLALALFAIGFYFQAAADWQLQHFRKTRTDPAQVLDTGVWALSRHPNYFGEVMIWWSFGALALVHPWGFVALLAPVYVTWFMAQGSATPMQERYLAKTKPGYADYARRVPKFFPIIGSTR